MAEAERPEGIDEFMAGLRKRSAELDPEDPEWFEKTKALLAEAADWLEKRGGPEPRKTCPRCGAGPPFWDGHEGFPVEKHYIMCIVCGARTKSCATFGQAEQLWRKGEIE